MTALRLRAARRPGWSVAALGLCLAAEAVTLAVVVRSQDSGDVRWWLVALPLGAAALPLLVPARRARVSAAVVLFAWCVVASASVGLFFVPGLVAAAGAAIRDGRERL